MKVTVVPPPKTPEDPEAGSPPECRQIPRRTQSSSISASSFSSTSSFPSPPHRPPILSPPLSLVHYPLPLGAPPRCPQTPASPAAADPHRLLLPLPPTLRSKSVLRFDTATVTVNIYAASPRFLSVSDTLIGTAHALLFPLHPSTATRLVAVQVCFPQSLRPQSILILDVSPSSTPTSAPYPSSPSLPRPTPPPPSSPTKPRPPPRPHPTFFNVPFDVARMST